MKEENGSGDAKVERVDDIPVIFGLLQKGRIQASIDRVIQPHGNWQGLSPGWVIAVWLIHILTEHSHCMDGVQEWVAKRLEILRKLTEQEVTELDFTDDRLALCLKMLSQAANWHAIEEKVGGHIIRVYRLEEDPTVRIDATTGMVYHDAAKHMLFKLGKGKDGNYAIQFKLMLASLDPLGLTLAVDVVPGDRADDPLYIPCYRRIKQVLPEPGVLVVGDSKMSAIGTRGDIANEGDFYQIGRAHV